MLRHTVAALLRQDKRRRWAAIGMVIGLLLILFPKVLYLPVADRQCQSYFKRSLIEASASYLACRGIIGGLGIVEHSQISVEPFGIGVDVEPARITDPLKDVAERASDVLFTAIVTLTAEDVGYDITRMFVAPTLGVLLLMMSLAALLTRRSQGFQNLAFRVILLLLALRIALPVSAGVSSAVNRDILAPRITAADANIRKLFPTQDIKALSDWSLPRVSIKWYSPFSFGSSAAAYAHYAFDRIAAVLRVILAVTVHMKPLADNVTELSGLYFAQILFNAVLIPLGIYWLLVKLFNSLFSTRLPPILRPETLQPAGSQPRTKPDATA